MSAFDVGSNSIQQRIVREFFATTGLVLLLTAGALSGTAFLFSVVDGSSRSDSLL